MPRRKPRPLRKRHVRGELRAVVDETIALFHRLAWVAEQIYGDEGRSTARRGVLRGLVRYGPQTVPQLARARRVSRQHVQEVADALLHAGLVERFDNPRHLRSKLWRATKGGEAAVRRMDQIDDRVLFAASGQLARGDLSITVRTLKAMREGFELTPRWRRVL